MFNNVVFSLIFVIKLLIIIASAMKVMNLRRLAVAALRCGKAVQMHCQFVAMHCQLHCLFLEWD